MKILFVTPGMGYGGAERVISLLANAFVVKNHDVKIIIINSKGKSVYELHNKIEIEVIPSLKKKNILSKLELLKCIRHISLKYKPDVIISFMNDTCAITILATLGAHYPIIYSERNDPSNTKKSIRDKIYKLIVQGSVQGFVFQSFGARALYPKRVQEKSVVILNPIDTQKLPYYYGERKKNIVTVGRLHPQKNHQMLIRAFYEIASEYPEYNLLIYGEGKLREALEELIKKLEMCDRIYLMGSMPNVLEKINDASIFALSSDYEGLPNALIEAMALGLSCISTDCSPGGAAMLIEHTVNGLLVPINDIEMFSDGLRYLISHQQKAITMGYQAKKVVEKMKVTIIAEQWEKFIFNIINKGSSYGE